MTDQRSKRPQWNRRDVRRRAAPPLAAAYGLPCRDCAQAQCPTSSTAPSSSSRRPSPTRSAAACCATASPRRPPHFDVHQSGTINNLGSQGCMFDNLIRRDPRDSGKTIIPDLAHSWEICQGRQDLHLLPAQGRAVPRRRRADRRGRQGHLRPHRQAAGGHQHPAQHPVQRGRARSTRRDKHTVRVQAGRAAAGQLHHVGASPAAGTSSCARRRWRTTTTTCAASSTFPGTGPFKSKRRVENEVWVMEKNPNYWNKGLPYLDGIEFYHAPAVLARAGLGRPVGPRRLCAHRRSGHGAQGQGDARHVVAPTTTRASSRPPG